MNTPGQTQIPTLQTPNDSLNQIQQNINKVLRNMFGQINTLTSSVDELEIIGEIKLSPLTLAQFQAQAGKGWIQANGQSCIGTQYSLLTANKTVPNISVTGANAFIKVN